MIEQSAQSQDVAGPAVLESGRMAFCLTVAYLAFEFCRVQEVLTIIGALRIPGLVTLALGLTLAFGGGVRWGDRPTRLFLLLLALMVPHVPLATNNFWAFHILRGMLITFVAYLGIVSTVTSLGRIRALVTAWLAIHVFLAINGTIRGGRGIGGFLGDENDFAMTLNMAIPFAFYLAVGVARGMARVVYLAVAGLLVFANVLTLSRGGFIGLAAVGLVCWLRSGKKLVAGTVIGLLVMLMLFAAPAKYWDEVRSIQNASEDPTGEDRLYMWTVGWAMYLHNPVFGVGQGNFPFDFREYEIASGNEDGIHGRSRAGRAAHSLYFTLLPELGLAGTLLFAGMVWSTMKTLRQAARACEKLPADEGHLLVALSRAIEASLVGYLTTGVLISVFYYPNFWVLMGFAVALGNVANAANNKHPSPD